MGQVSATPMTVEVLIPVYNEAENIERTLDALSEGLAALPEGLAQVGVCIVYDHPEDTTLAVLDRVARKYPFHIRRLINPTPGVIGALKEGFFRSQADFILVTMADLSDDYTTLGPMLMEAAQGADVVCASRYMKGGRLNGGPFLKQLFSRIAGVSLHFLRGFPTHDITNSYKLYRQSALQSLTLESRGGFEIGMEITAKIFLLGGKIAEVPTQWWDRTAGLSRFRLAAWLPRYLHWYMTVLAATVDLRSRPAKGDRLATGLLFAGLIAVWLLAASPLSLPLTDAHAFRQTQTAISVWAMIKDGMHISYATPVLGAPWAIPMEFPLYQWIVAGISKIPGMQLETAGRLVSLVAFWVAMATLFPMLRHRVRRSPHRAFLVALVAISPLYLFWARAFLIETLSLALCLGFVGTFHQALRKQSHVWLVTSVLVGSIAALVKITSLPAYLLLAVLIWIASQFRFPGPVVSAPLPNSWTLIPLAAPLVAGSAWTIYTDHVKAANPLAASFLTSHALSQWNFGTWAQRMAVGTWEGILSHTLALKAYWVDTLLDYRLPVIAALFLLAWLTGRTRRMEVLVCLGLFLVNPLCFTNLHFVHNYYAVPNVLFFSLALGFAVLALLEDQRRAVRACGMAMGALLALTFFQSYWCVYHPRQAAPPAYPAMADEIRRQVPDQAVLLVYGRDWNPLLPFAARRRALMDRWVLPLASERFQAAIQATGRENIQAMLAPVSFPPKAVRERCLYFGLQLKPVASINGENLYIR